MGIEIQEIWDFFDDSQMIIKKAKNGKPKITKSRERMGIELNSANFECELRIASRDLVNRLSHALNCTSSLWRVITKDKSPFVMRALL